MLKKMPALFIWAKCTLHTLLNVLLSCLETSLEFPHPSSLNNSHPATLQARVTMMLLSSGQKNLAVVS